MLVAWVFAVFLSRPALADVGAAPGQLPARWHLLLDE